MTSKTIPSLSIGPTLRCWRLLHRIKQAHAAELFGVDQSTISRWEAGQQEMEPSERVKVEAVVSARLDSAADRILATLVTESPRPIHLMCDLTHRLLACSSSRANEFRVPSNQLLGRSLRRYATTEIRLQEQVLIEHGWFTESAPAPIEFNTSANDSHIVPIWPSRCRWTRLRLSDGRPARLVETLKRFRQSSTQDRLARSAF